MTVTELMERVKAEMTGDAKADYQRLSEIAQEYKREENAGELLEAIANFAFDMLPPDTRDEMKERTFVREMRMDRAFAEALKMIREDKSEEAEALLAEISGKIRKYFEQGEQRWFCFRNPFEYHVYRYYNPDDTGFDRAPFDFTNYLQTYAFVLLNNGKGLAALQALDRAVALNPVSVDPRFEQTEIYKLMRMPEKLLENCRETIRFATTASTFARVAADMGYYCTMKENLQDAAVFFFDRCGSGAAGHHPPHAAWRKALCPAVQGTDPRRLRKIRRHAAAQQRACQSGDHAGGFRKGASAS